MTTVKIEGRNKLVGTISASNDRLSMSGDVETLKEVVAGYYDKGNPKDFVRSLPRHYRSAVQATITRDDDSDQE